MLVAHGIGGRTDLPLPSWQVAWAAGFAVASAFIVLNFYWQESRLAPAATGKMIASADSRSVRVVSAALSWLGVAALVVVVVAAWSGPDEPSANLSVGLLLIWFWVGFQIASAAAGDVWAELNPYDTIASRLRGFAPGLASARTTPPIVAGTTWPAVATISIFLWLELAYHDTANPTSIAVFLTAYSAAMVVGAVRWGSAWLRSADGFTVLFTLLAALSPVYRDATGAVRGRVPLSGLQATASKPGLVPFILVVLGSTTFDGFTRTEFWSELEATRSGWDATLLNSTGLVIIIGLVAGLYYGTIALMARATGETLRVVSDRFGLSLVPIVVAYSIAHYFSLVILEGQRSFAHLSDPFGRGWNLFGTADWTIEWTIVSASTISWVQAIAIATGHVLAVVAAHDTAVTNYDRQMAKKSQYPMLAAMIAYTVIGLFLLLGD